MSLLLSGSEFRRPPQLAITNTIFYNFDKHTDFVFCNMKQMDNCQLQMCVDMQQMSPARTGGL